MIGNYGYMEEGKLGKPYNLRLLKRLSRYALPYKKTVALALFLSILLTLCMLAIPYLSKIAIDRYIISSWYRVDTQIFGDTFPADIPEHYQTLFEKSQDGSTYFVSNLNMKEIDPADLHDWKQRGIITTEKYYRTGIEPQLTGIPIIEMAEDAFLVPYENLKTLARQDIRELRAGNIRGVTLVAMVALVLLVFSFVLSYLEHYLLELVGQNVMQDIRLSLFRKVQSYSLRFFDRNPVGRLVTRVTNDVENLNEMFKSVVITVFKDIFVLIGIFGILLYLKWQLALMCFTLIPFIFGLTFLFSRMAREAFREVRTTIARINAFLQERVTGMRVIQLFAREKFQMGVFTRINHDNYLAGMKQVKVFAMFMPLMEFFSSVAVALLIWYGGAEVVQEALTLGTLVAFISYLQMFFKPIREISEKYNIMQSAMASTERIFAFMDIQDNIQEPEHPKTPVRLKGHLVFDQVSFSYESGRPVLENISFEVKPGETVAVVGATGAGKTTLVNLIERFYDPDKGTVTLDGIDLKEWSTAELHKHVSICMQDVFIFAGNVADNISLGRKRIDDEAVRKASSEANALGFIERFKNGFQQDVGEGGATLSGGERQLLSFARALASEPTVLILDEATSSVDPETERLIQDAISRMSAERTTLVVAHRLSTVRDADRILVMHKGQIREQGKHEELMALGGIYFKLNRLRGLEAGRELNGDQPSFAGDR